MFATVFHQFINKFLPILLCIINVFNIYMVDFFHIFVIARSTEIGSGIEVFWHH